MRTPALVWTGLVAGGLLAPVAAIAHHAFAAEFDRDQPIEITGTVTKVEWMNPHARFYVDVEDEYGAVVNWDFELGSPNGLMRQGWRRDSLRPGDTVTVSGWRARNVPNVANARSVKLADGREVFAGSSGGDAR
jgi:Family of unknown function (DUF6152)